MGLLVSDVMGLLVSDVMGLLVSDVMGLLVDMGLRVSDILLNDIKICALYPINDCMFRESTFRESMFRQNGLCNNCNKPGHLVQQCKLPITSVGIVLVRFNPTPEYLLIRRQHSIGFVEFLRGKYKVHNKLHLLQLIAEMTETEKKNLLTCSFDELWGLLWLSSNRAEEAGARDKFETIRAGVTVNHETYTLQQLVQLPDLPVWTEQEWGFPKGRPNHNETEVYCAQREFTEETGILLSHISMVQNIAPFQEIFMGSNYKCYLHKYYLAVTESHQPLNMEGFQVSEVSKMHWASFDEAVQLFRPYNLERIKTLKAIHEVMVAATLTWAL